MPVSIKQKETLKKEVKKCTCGCGKKDSKKCTCVDGKCTIKKSVQSGGCGCANIVMNN